MDYLILVNQIQGQVLLPEDSGYDEARLAWNRTVDQHPAVIVIAHSAQDVIAAVNHARQHNLGVAVQATGHGNIRPANDCLLILTHEMNGVEVDPATQTARFESGVKWGAVLAAAQEHGLAPLLGSSPGVGAVGYTLGGGLGWLGRKYGLAADNMVKFELVTADGRLRTASADENSDLFWALRGGGGSLGIVTSMTIRLFPVTEVYAGNLFYPAGMAKEVFRHYRAWIAGAPDELTTSVLVMNFPPFPELPEFLRGQTFAIVRGCYCGPDLAEGEKLLNHWREWQSPLVDDFKPLPFSRAAEISNDPKDPLPGKNTGVWLRELSDAAIDTIVDYAVPRNGPSPLIFAEIRHAGGAIHRVSPESSPFGNREAEHILWLIGITPTPAAYAHFEAYTKEIKQALEPYLTGGVYMNALDGEESRNRVQDGLAPGAYERLAQLKAHYDPQNLFQYGFNIQPAG